MSGELIEVIKGVGKMDKLVVCGWNLFDSCVRMCIWYLYEDGHNLILLQWVRIDWVP